MMCSHVYVYINIYLTKYELCIYHPSYSYLTPPMRGINERSMIIYTYVCVGNEIVIIVPGLEIREFSNFPDHG